MIKTITPLAVMAAFTMALVSAGDRRIIPGSHPSLLRLYSADGAICVSHGKAWIAARDMGGLICWGSDEPSYWAWKFTPGRVYER